MLKTSIREAFFILAASIVLAVCYTGFTSKGVFAPKPKEKPVTESTSAPQFISYEEAVILFEKQNALFVDARHEYDFLLGHIKGAVNVPLADIHTNPDMLSRLDKGRTLVTYCDGVECNSSIGLATTLDSLGYKDVKIFFGGWKEWESHGKPVEKDK